MSIHVPAIVSEFDKRQQLVTDLLNTLSSMKNAGRPIDGDELAKLEGADDKRVRQWVKLNTDITDTEWKASLRRARILDELGTVPHDAQGLVAAVAKRDRMECTYSGIVTRNVLPMLENAQGKMEVVPTELMEDEIIRTKVHFTNVTRLDKVEFQRSLRLINDDVKLGFTERQINDAVEAWHVKAQRNRRFDLFSQIARLYSKDRDLVEEMWRELALQVFQTDGETTAEFVVAVLKKFMWQVKRKIRGLPVTDHLMPVIIGPQGCGKSTLVRQLIQPIEELSLNVDFKMIEDDRNIEIWRAYVLFLDEMGYASKTNVDTVKNAITATTLTRRPLYTNGQVSVEQNATFVGCSNKELEQLIKDPTGIRRFVALRFQLQPSWELMNAIDWRMMWAGVDHEGPDPMKAFKAKLATLQEETRELGRVEDWIEQFDAKTDPAYCQGVNTKTRRIKSSDLYTSFKEFEEHAYPGVMKTSMTEWSNEMKRITANHPGRMPFTRLPRSSTGNFYIYNDEHTSKTSTR